MKTIGFIGLGAMGRPMAAHLARAGAQTGGRTLVWARAPAKAQAHAQQHGTHAVSLPELAQAEVLFSCLPTSAEVDEVQAALLPHLRPGTYWVDCTSGHPDAALRQHAALAARGVRFMDAPISGGTKAAEEGTLTMMFGGSAEDVAAVRPTLAFGGKVVHVGAVGAGFAVKAINNALLAVNLWAAGEGLAVLAQAGVNLSAALDVINASSGRSNASENLIPQRVLTRQFPATFALGLLAKDAGIAADLIGQQRSSAPVLAQAAALYRGASRVLDAQEDHTAALKLIEQMNGVELK